MDLQAIELLSARLSPLLYGFGVGMIVLETMLLTVMGLPRDRRKRWISVGCGLLGFGTEGLVHASVLLGVQLWMYQHRLFDPGLVWWVWPLCFVLNDLMFYVSHRAGHRVRLLWAVHCVHHSARSYDLTTGIRGSALGVFTAFPFVFWIPLLGIHPLVFLIVDKLFKFYGLAYHTEAIRKLGWLDRWLITPSVHRVHHATQARYVDKNYGGFFLVFDRLFGTWEPEVEAPTYGLVKDLEPDSVWQAQTHELRDLWADMRGARGLGEALGYALRPPGWVASGAD
jgi:sterol desaturase/sphingolipid hydroxylase (fatty acid hydroxylase superfamily)